VDVQGAATVRRLVPHVVDIFLTAESETELINRLQRRRTETDFELQRRIEAARSELKQVDNFKYRVINRECQVDQTVDQVIAIMHAEKCRTGWRPVQL